MVDVSNKDVTSRVAVAESRVQMTAETLALVRDNKLKKGDVLQTARLAGIMAAKKTAELIPLCHPLAISSVQVDLELAEKEVVITATVKCTGQTGVEMEALTAASVAALTVYDMCKAVEKSITIGPTRLLEKHGWKSGSYSPGSQ